MRLGEGAQVSGDVSAVNGTADLAKGASVGGGLSNVNGKMKIDAAHVGGGLKTVNGDITLGPEARVEGGILVEKPNGGWNIPKRHIPRISSARAVVDGRLRFEHEVELYVSAREDRRRRRRQGRHLLRQPALTGPGRNRGETQRCNIAECCTAEFHPFLFPAPDHASAATTCECSGAVRGDDDFAGAICRSGRPIA